MSQSLASLLTHLVFSTKHRERLIHDGIRDELHRYSASILQDLESPAILINSVEDHIHVLFTLSKNHALKEVVEKLKTGTSKWIKRRDPALASFYWQAGYGAFSVSQSKVDAVIRYIANQREHHATVSFQDEVRTFFHKHRMEFDERYVWD
jgi:REP element-mobilizing transposase RayT